MSRQRLVLSAAILACSTILIALATLAPSAANQSTPRLCLICGAYGGVDAVLNVLLFMPLGLGLALASVRPLHAALGMLAATLMIETAQLEFVAGRDASVGDVLMNTLGGVAGYAIGWFRAALSRPRPETAVRLLAAALLTWLGIQALVAFSFTPTLPEPPYYGQIDRPAGQFRPAFPGDVISSLVGSEPLTRGVLPNARRIKELFEQPAGTPLTAIVVGAGSVSGKAEIVVISGRHMIAAASLEQDRYNLVFGVRTGAEALRLRPYEYRLKGAFDEPGAAGRGDTITLSGRFSRSGATVAAIRGTDRRERRFVPRLSQGWMLVVPFRAYIDDDLLEYSVSALYMLVLIVPAGYWAAFAKPALRTANARSTAMAILSFIIVAAGLTVVPAVAGLRPAHVAEWTCVVVGVLAGYAFARLVRRGPRAPENVSR